MAGRAARLTTRTISEFFADGCPQRAAAISYYGLFSLFPLVILLVAIFGLVVDSDEARRRVVDFVLRELPLQPEEGQRRIEELLATASAGVGGFGVVGLAGLVFSASGVMGAIRHGLNAAWGTADARPPLQGKLVDVGLILGLGVAVAGAFALTIAVQLAPLGALAPIGGRIASLGVDALIIAVLFRLVPAPRTSLRDTWPGVALAAVGIEVAKSGFAYYLQTAASYNAVYASIGSVIALLVFVFLAANVFLLGAEAAAEWPDVRDGRGDDAPDDRPLRERAAGWLRSLVLRRDDPRSEREPQGPETTKAR